jgi:hypothetical protein
MLENQKDFDKTNLSSPSIDNERSKKSYTTEEIPKEILALFGDESNERNREKTSKNSSLHREYNKNFSRSNNDSYILEEIKQKLDSIESKINEQTISKISEFQIEKPFGEILKKEAIPNQEIQEINTSNYNFKLIRLGILLSFVISSMWFYRDPDYESAMAVLASSIAFIGLLYELRGKVFGGLLWGLFIIAIVTFFSSVIIILVSLMDFIGKRWIMQ